MPSRHDPVDEPLLDLSPEALRWAQNEIERLRAQGDALAAIVEDVLNGRSTERSYDEVEDALLAWRELPRPARPRLR